MSTAAALLTTWVLLAVVAAAALACAIDHGNQQARRQRELRAHRDEDDRR